MTGVEQEQRRILFCVVGCLGMVAILVGIIAFAIVDRHRQARLFFERAQETWRQEAFDSVKQGRTSAFVMDSKLLPMLATDADCRKNVTRLDFSSTDIVATDASFVAELANVTSMSFYCTRGTKGVLVAARSLPITDLFFEMPDLPVESYLMLKDFPHLKKVRFEQVMDDEWIERLRSEMPNVVIDAPFPRSGEPGFTK